MKIVFAGPFKGPAETSLRRHQASDDGSHLSANKKMNCQIHHLNYNNMCLALCFHIMYTYTSQDMFIFNTQHCVLMGGVCVSAHEMRLL